MSDSSGTQGEVLAGRYRITGTLGSGGMGEVFRGVHIELGRDVAIKRLKKELSVDQSVLKRFINEARAVNVIRHENIVEVTDFFTDADGRVHMVMELLEGRSLGELIRARAPLPPERVAHIGAQMADALLAAHEHGVIHRDLKPENVFLIQRKSTDDYVKLLDFGIARLHPDCGGIEATESGLIIGTPVYMPPEQAKGGHVTWAADAYSLGIILYEMLCGTWPFDRASAVQMMMAHIADPPEPLEVEGLDPAFRALVESCLAKEPEDRPQSMKAIAERLEAWGQRTKLTESDVLPERMPEQSVSDTVMARLDSEPELSAQTWDLPAKVPLPLSDSRARARKSPWFVGAVASLVLAAAFASYFLIKGRARESEASAPVPAPSPGGGPSLRALQDEDMAAMGLPPTPPSCKSQGGEVLDSQRKVASLLAEGGPGSKREQDKAALRVLGGLASDISPETSLWKARAHLQLGEPELAIKNAEQAYEGCPTLAAAFAIEGTALAFQGQHEAASESLSRALALREDYLDARFNLALSQLATDELPLAIENLSKVVELDPQTPGAHYLRGQSYLQVGDIERARVDLEVAVRKAEDNASAWFALGYTRHKSGDTAGASEAYCSAADLGHARAPCARSGRDGGATQADEREWPEGWQVDPLEPSP